MRGEKVFSVGIFPCPPHPPLRGTFSHPRWEKEHIDTFGHFLLISQPPFVCRALLFDLDGTLVDTLDDLAASVNFVLGKLGKPARSREEIREFIGGGVRSLLRDALGSGYSGPIEDAVALFEPHYLEHCADRSTLYPGVLDTLDRLSRSHLLAVVTNKPEAPSRFLLEGLRIDGYFKALIGGDTLAVKKPDPAPLREAARRLKVASADAMMVGDSAGDIRAAHDAGARACGATYGYRPAGELTEAGADFLIDRPADLLRLV